MRFLSGRGIRLTHSFLDDETEMVVSAASVIVANDKGESVFDGDAIKIPDTETWEANLPILPLGRYFATWDASPVAVDSTPFEVVGGFLFSIPEARASDVDLEDRFTTEEIRYYREVVEAEFEQITGRSFTLRSKRVDVNGDGTPTAFLGFLDAVRVVDVEGLAEGLTPDGWTITPTGFLEAPYELAEGSRYTVTVEYGMPAGLEDVKRAALLRLRTLLVTENSGIPDRAISFVSAEGGNFSLATAGRNGYETGIPEVDATLSRYRYKILGDVMGVG